MKLRLLLGGWASSSLITYFDTGYSDQGRITKDENIHAGK